MEINSKPEELDVLDRKVMQLEIEIEAIKREDETKLKTLGMDLANLKEDRNEIYAKWKSEKDVVDNIQAIKTEDFKYEAERAEREEIMAK
jgi:ATP-dependent Clp protease ATP-binding subunit ClpB